MSDHEEPGRILRDDIVPAGAPWSGLVEKGRLLRIVDLEGRQGVDFLCYNAHDTAERYNAPNTIKKSRTLRLTVGHVFYSDIANAMFTVVGDTCDGHHDTIGGCCGAATNTMLYGVPDCPGCRENLLTALGEHGMGRRDMVPNLNFFCHVPVYEGGRLAERTFVEAPSHAGDHIELRAEMDTIVVISNCPQVNNPASGGKPTPIRVLIREAR
jgi:urea carboxylase-associated protein 1